jgi:uncharacterized GH25 family protein
MPAAAPALADSGGDSKPQFSSLASLIIKSPNTVEVGQPATIAVFSKRGHEPIAGASVYALKTSDLVVTANAAGYTALLGDYEALAKAKGTLFGTTGSDGMVKLTFSETGRFMLVATGDGYIPGFTRISVTIAGQQKLGVRAPASAAAGRQVTIKAFESKGGQPVDNATIFAFSPRTIMPPTIRQAPAAVIDSTLSPLTSAEAQILINENRDRSFLIGYTNGNGELQFTFKDPGLYVLVAAKDGYLPGGTRINIKGIQPSKALEINAPSNLSDGQPVTLKVQEKGSGQPVVKAAVYVLKISGAGDIKVMPPTANNGKAQNSKANFKADVKARPPTANNDKAQGEANRDSEKGALAGYTDDNGQLVFTFSSSGQYVLSAFKDGYSPAFKYITCTLPVSKKSLFIEAPYEATAGNALDIVISDAGGNALGKVAIYSLRMDVVAQAAAILQSAAKPDAAARDKYGPILRERSSLLGYTDDSGRLTVKFSRTGAFMLLATRDGYLPDFAKINIKPALPPVPVPLPIPVPPSDNATATEK